MNQSQIFTKGLKFRWVLLLILAGFLLSAVKTFAPIHELGHIIAYRLIGIRAGFSSWASVWHVSDSNFGLSGGYFFEISVAFALSFLPFKKLRFFLCGLMLEILIEAPFSNDFHMYRGNLVSFWLTVAIIFWLLTTAMAFISIPKYEVQWKPGAVHLIYPTQKKSKPVRFRG